MSIVLEIRKFDKLNREFPNGLNYENDVILGFVLFDRMEQRC